MRLVAKLIVFIGNLIDCKVGIADLSLGGAHSSVSLSPGTQLQCSKFRAVNLGVETRKDSSQAAVTRLPLRWSSCKRIVSRWRNFKGGRAS